MNRKLIDRNLISLVLIAILISSCHSVKDFYYNYDANLEIGAEYYGDLSCGMLWWLPISPSDISIGYHVYKNNTEYIIKLNNDNRINLITTRSRNFKVGNYKRGDTIPEEILKNSGVIPFSHRAYKYGTFVPIDSGWVARILPSDRIIRDFYKTPRWIDSTQLTYSAPKKDFKYNYEAKIEIGEKYNGYIGDSTIKLPLSEEVVNEAVLYKDEITYRIGVDENKTIIYIECYPNSNPYIDTNINPYSIIPEISPKTRPTGTILTEKGYDEVYIKFKKNWYIQYSNMKNYLNNEGWGYYAKYYKWK